MQHREACEVALKEKHFRDAHQKEGFVDENDKSNLDQLKALDQLFKKVTEDDTPTEVRIDVLNTLGRCLQTLQNGEESSFFKSNSSQLMRKCDSRNC